MPRYAKQLDRYSCGPTAIANMLKWGGVRLNYKRDRKRLIADCGSSFLRGTSSKMFNSVLRFYGNMLGVSVRRKYRPKLADIDRHLSQGGIVIVNYEHRKGRHYAVITEGDGRTYNTVNAYRVRKAVHTITRRMLKREMLYYRTSFPFKLWLID